MGVNAVQIKIPRHVFHFQPCVKAMDQSWHPEHFQCYGCLVVFSDNMSYREKVLRPSIVLSAKVWFSLKPWTLQDTRPYCEHCYQDTVLPKCGGCRWRAKIRKGSILKSHISETRSQTRLLKLSTSTGTPSALSARWVMSWSIQYWNSIVILLQAWLALMSSSNDLGLTFKFWALSSRLGVMFLEVILKLQLNHPC